MAFDLEKIRGTAERVAASHHIDVVDVEFVGPGKRPVLRIFIEKDARERARLAQEKLLQERQAAGEQPALDRLAWITHEDCEAFSRDFGTVIEVEGEDPDRQYVLEVSSPGLDRKLRGAEDYRRFTGSTVKIETVEPVAGSRHWRGALKEIRGDRILIDVSPSGKKPSRGKRGKPGSRSRQLAELKTSTEPAVLEIELANIAKANLVPEF